MNVNLKYLILVLLSLSTFPNVCFGQSKIGKAEKSLSSEKRSSNKPSSSNNDFDSNFFIDVFGRLIIDGFVYTVYSVLIESPPEYNNKSANASITKYPYNKNNKGNFTYDLAENSTRLRTTISSKYVFENSRINGNHLNINLKFLKRIGVETNYLQLWEDNPNFGKDKLALYSFLAKYHRVRTETFDFWWGLGTTYTDGDVNSWGFTYGLGIDLFIINPISFESAFNQTFVNDDTVNKFDLILNYHYKSFKFSGGYEHLRIGSENFSMILLGAGISF